MLIMTVALVGAVASSGVDKSFVHQAQRACAASIQTRPRVAGILVERLAGEVGDLPKLRITDRQSGGWMLAYYDPSGERAAYARAACLGAQIRMLAMELGGDRREQWFSTVFTSNASYVAPPRQTVTRWIIAVERDGSIGEQGQSMVVLTMPHEQVHRFQKRAGTELPRWLEEGHAEWISRKVRKLFSPGQAQEDEDGYKRSFDANTDPVELSSWGAMRVSREAIMRQVPPEERRRMQADPAYTAPLSGRSFSFGPGDVTSDERNLKARYEASWRLFRDLEAAHGQAAVQSWVAQLTSRPGRVDGATAIRSAGDVLHEDLNTTLG